MAAERSTCRLFRESRARHSIAQADLVVMSIGANDLYGDSLARLLTNVWPWYQRERTISKVESLVAQVRQINPRARICILGLYNPYQASRVCQWIDAQVNPWDGALIQRLSEMRGVTVIRIADVLARADGLVLSTISTQEHWGMPRSRGESPIRSDRRNSGRGGHLQISTLRPKEAARNCRK